MKQRKKRTVPPAVMAVLSALCMAIWIFRIFVQGENDSLTVVAGIVWTVCAVVWGIRTVRDWKAGSGR